MTSYQHARNDENVRKHLELIQTVVTRMSAASSTAKGWLLPVATAAYGFAMTQHSGAVALLGIGAVLVFSYIDANYLRQERAFRRLYRAVVDGDPSVPVFSLDVPGAAPLAADQARTRLQRIRTVIITWIPGWRIWTSWSIVPFYGAMVILGVGVLIYASVT